MKREEMMDYLQALDPAGRLPLWVISYRRAGTAPLLERAKHWSTAGTVNVLVRDEEREAYETAYPMMTIHSLPGDCIGNCGSARWGAAELAYADGEEAALMLDDDILVLNCLFEGAIRSGPNTGKPSSVRTLRGDHAAVPGLEEMILAGISDVARQVFRENPNAMLGSAIKQHMSFDVRNHQTKYTLNGGVTPRQVMVYHLERMRQRGVQMNRELFGVHGEDLGMNAEVLQAGGDCFAMPSFVYDVWSEDINIRESVIRNAENAQALHAAEWDALQTYPIRDYLRTKRSIIDGSYEWGDVNWPALHKIRGTATKQEPWGNWEDLL